MAQDVLIVNRNGGGVGTEVNKCASRTLFCISEHSVGECQRSKIHLCDCNASHIETFVQAAVELISPQNVEEVSLKARALDAHRVELKLVVNLILLCRSIKYFLVLITHVAIGVHQFVHHHLCDDGLSGKCLDDVVLHTSNRLSAHSHIHMRYFLLQCGGEFLHNVCDALCRLVDVINHTLVNERRGVFLHQGKNSDATVEILLSRDAGHLR